MSWFWHHTLPTVLRGFRASVYRVTVCRARGHKRSFSPLLVVWDKGHICARCYEPLGWGVPANSMPRVIVDDAVEPSTIYVVNLDDGGF